MDALAVRRGSRCACCPTADRRCARGIVGPRCSSRPPRARGTSRCSRAPCSASRASIRKRGAATPCGRCSRTRVAKIGHDLKVDALVLARHGVALEGLGVRHDARQLPARSDAIGHGLEDTALEHLGYKALSEEDVCGKGVKAATLGAAAARRAPDLRGRARGSRAAAGRRAAAEPSTRGSTRVYRELEMPLVPVLVGIEQAGVRIDGPALAAQSQRIERELRDAERADLRAGRRASSTSTRRSSWRTILFDKLQLPVGSAPARPSAVDRRRSARGAGAHARAAAARSSNGARFRS